MKYCKTYMSYRSTLHFMQQRREFFLHTSHLPCFSNSTCNGNLMDHFEFLHGLRMICLPLDISEKLHYQHLFEKLGKADTQELLNNNKCHSRKREPSPFFHSDTNLVLGGHVLVHSAGKTYVLSVTVELTWLLFLNTLSFNFFPTPNKYLRFRRFRRSYVNCHVVIPTNYCHGYTALSFLLDVRCSK